MKKIAVFASGGGTDFQSVIDANERDKFCEIKYLVASKEGIGAIERAKKAGIETAVFSKKDYPSLEELYERLAAFLKAGGVDYIVLAGWLKIIPASFIEAFKDKIINIHPSLIPSFCGKGFYGLNVHKAVLAAGETESGATVHYVDAGTDTGQIIRQTRVPVEPGDTPETLAARVLEAEHRLLPEVVADLCGEKANKTL